jgi:hypothetical protein
VTIGDQPAPVISSNTTTVVIVTPPGQSGNSNITVVVNGVNNTTPTGIYDPSSTPNVTSISPCIASTSFKTVITIGGNFFPTDTD